MSHPNRFHIQLIQPPADSSYQKLSRSGCFPPLGLLSLATSLRRSYPDAIIEVLDGELLSIEEIINRVGGQWVGVSASILTYHNALRIAEVAQGRGAKVIMGGHHATALATVILQHRKCVDYVVCGDGEEAICRLIGGTAEEQIANLAYRKQSHAHVNPVIPLPMASLPVIDRIFVNDEPYWNNWLRQNPNKPFRRPTSIYTQKGCRWRDLTDGCLFCARMDRGWRARNPVEVWSEITQLIDERGTDFIWETSDSILSSEQWLADFVAARPAHVNVHFLVYARPDELNQRTISLLQRIHAYEVFLGLESGDMQMLRKSRKGTTVDHNIAAVDLLAAADIRVFPSFVLGLPGENATSLGNTVRHAQDVVARCTADVMAVSLLMPLPGSQAYRQLARCLDYESRKYYLTNDDLQLDRLQKDWLRMFCEADKEQCEDARNRILAMAPVPSGYDRPETPGIEKMNESSSLVRHRAQTLSTS